MTSFKSISFPNLPPYTYVPGVTPHPISDVLGHMYDQPDDFHAGWGLSNWMQWGQILFDGGCYWEAHEAWEHLWIELGRRGHDADSVKGLIKLAACGVKVLESNQIGAIRHAKRAVELLSAGIGEKLYGFELAGALRIAEAFVSDPNVRPILAIGQPKPIPGFALSQ